MTGQKVLAPLVLHILYIFMYMCMNVYVCGNQRSTSMSFLRTPATLSFETRFLSGLVFADLPWQFGHQS